MDIPGNTTTTTTVTPTTPVSSDIGFGGDLDYIIANLNKHLSYSFTLSSPTLLFEQYLELRDPVDVLIDSAVGDKNDLGVDATIYYTPQSSEPYFLVASSPDGHIGNYTLTMNADDTIENHTSTTTSVTSGMPVTSNIDVIGDSDYIAAAFNNGAMYSISLTTTSSGFEQQLRIRNSSNAILETAIGTAALPIEMTYIATSTSVHYLDISDFGDTSTGNYTLTINDDDTIGGDISSALLLGSGTVLSSAIDLVSDVDYLQIYLDGDIGLSYGFSLSTTSSDLEQKLELIEEGFSVRSATGDNTTHASFTYTPLVPFGAYYLAVSDAGDDDVGNYVVTINNSDTIGSTDIGASFISGGSVSSNIDVTGDIDRFNVSSLADGLTYGFTLTTTTIGLVQTLFASAGGIGSASGAGPSTPAELIYTQMGDPGPFNPLYIDVAASSVGATETTGDYTLTINSDDTIGGTIPTATLLGSGTTFASAIDLTSDVDYLQIYLDGDIGLSYGFSLSTTSSDLEQRLELIEEGFSVRTATGDNTTAASFTYTPLVPFGAYHLAVSDVGDDDVGDYTITINDSDDIGSTDIGASFIFGSSVSSNIDVTGDVDRFVFDSLNEGYTYGFSLTTTTTGLVQVLSGIAGAGSSSPAEFVHTQIGSGTFHPLYLDVLASSVGATETTGDYTLTINNDDTIGGTIPTAAAIGIGDLVSSSTDLATDIDVFSIAVTASDKIGIALFGNSVDYSPSIEILNATGSVLQSATGTYANPARISDFIAPATDTFYLRVSDVEDDDASDYQLVTYSFSDDFVVGTAGDDNLFGGAGSDTLIGSGGNDNLYYVGDDSIPVASRTDVDGWDGGDDIDTADFGYFHSAVQVDFTAADEAQTRDSTDLNSGTLRTIAQMANMENIKGSRFDDSLSGDAAANELEGNSGNDALFGGLGDDTASYANATGDVSVYLQYSGLDVGGDQGIDTLVSIENLTGGNFNDRLIGDGGDNVLIGGSGNDILKGKEGNDTFFGGDGDDTIRGGAGIDIMHGGSGSDILFALAGDDILNGGDDRDFVYGGKDADTVHGDGGDDEVRGNRGDDVIFGDAGEDDLRGGGGKDSLDGGDDGDFLFGENGIDTLIGGAGSDSLTGGMGAGSFDGVQDTFVYSDTGAGGGGFDRIKDWENGIDQIDLTAFSFANFAAVDALASEAGSGDMRINFGGGDVLYIENFTTTDFDASDVILI